MHIRDCGSAFDEECRKCRVEVLESLRGGVDTPSGVAMERSAAGEKEGRKEAQGGVGVAIPERVWSGRERETDRQRARDREGSVGRRWGSWRQ